MCYYCRLQVDAMMMILTFVEVSRQPLMNLRRHSLLLPLWSVLIVLDDAHCCFFVVGCVAQQSCVLMVQCHHRHGDVSSSFLLVEMQSTPADGDDSHSIPALEGHHCRLFDIDCSSAGRPLSAWASEWYFTERPRAGAERECGEIMAHKLDFHHKYVWPVYVTFLSIYLSI